MKFRNRLDTVAVLASRDVSATGTVRTRGVELMTPFGGVRFERQTPVEVLVRRDGREQRLAIADGRTPWLAPLIIAPVLAIMITRMMAGKRERRPLWKRR